MSNPWDNDPVATAPASAARSPWDNDPVVSAPTPGVPPDQNVNYAYVPNRIVISSLTGRARLLKPRIP